MFGRCALRLRQCIHCARKRGVLSGRSAARSGPLVARYGQVHAPCEVETWNGHERRSAKQAHRCGVFGYKGARLAGGTQRLPRTIGTPAALMHILMGQPLNPREAEKKGLVHETVSGKALDRAMEIARRLSSHTPESLAYSKRLVRNATETPLAQGLVLERNLFLKLCISEAALARMRSYEEEHITSPSRSIMVQARSASHD